MKQNKLSYKIGQFLMFGGPATILFFAVVILPFFYGLYLTFTSWDGVSTTKPFVGLENYKAALADTAYWQSLGRTFIYSVIAVILTNIVAFLLAYLVTSGIKGQNFFRAGFFIPNLIGGIVLGYVWKFVFNRAFVAIAEAATQTDHASLLSTPNGAMFCLILVSVWQYAGYMMLIYVAGFMSVDQSLKEAAMIDGCNKGKAMWARGHPADALLLRSVHLPEHHPLLHGVRPEPFAYQGRTVQPVGARGNARLQPGIRLQELWHRSGRGVGPLHRLRSDRHAAGVLRQEG